ncbi:MAG: FKBP-type peptidyl-prolyl cis-trans isomerase [Treponema sp.]|jgi:FKBP-type peptidyl-prolyl cis-trans isomerase FkpA|nr:FKBP-type peptidyl-prolyl cis-trans isomerase [Treponema sp.]
MKNKNLIILTILLACCTFLGCGKNSSGSSAGEENFDKDASYALGMSIGMSLKESLEMDSIFPNYNEFLKGLTDGIYDKARFDSIEAMAIIETAFSALTEKQNAQAKQNETAFLAENSRKPGVMITSSGLQYEVITETGRRKPLMTDTVLVHYEGSLIDGTTFDSSYYGEPVELPLDAVVPGWSEGLLLMGAGSKYILYIPSDQGYGPSGMTNPFTGSVIIPPHATLIFTVELLEIL